MRLTVIGTLLAMLLATATALGARGPGVLGVGLSNASNTAAAEVATVVPGGAANRAGIQPGDLVTAINGRPVPDGKTLKDYVATMHAGEQAILDIVRPGPSPQKLRLTAVLTGPPGSGAAPVASQAAQAPQAPVSNAPALAQGNLTYRSYVDPAEQAFGVQVPQGWSVGGRLVRYGPISIAPFVQAMRPDGTVFVQIGDWHIGDFADIPGWAEGRLYTPGTSVEIVRRVRTADQFAREYATTFAQMLNCASPAFGASEQPPTPPKVTTAIPQARLQTSVAHFGCTRDGAHYTGQVMMTVQSYPLPMGTVAWNVLYLASVLSRDDHVGEGIAAWDTMRNSFGVLPAWDARESQIAAQAVQPGLQQLQATLNQAQTFDREVLNGNVLVQDSSTGARSEISMGVAPYYFTDGAGHYYNSYDPQARAGYHAANPVSGGQ